METFSSSSQENFSFHQIQNAQRGQRCFGNNRRDFEKFLLLRAIPALLRAMRVVAIWSKSINHRHCMTNKIAVADSAAFFPQNGAINGLRRLLKNFEELFC